MVRRTGSEDGSLVSAKITGLKIISTRPVKQTGAIDGPAIRQAIEKAGYAVAVTEILTGRGASSGAAEAVEERCLSNAWCNQVFVDVRTTLIMVLMALHMFRQSLICYTTWRML